MRFFGYKKHRYPLIAVVAALFLIVFGLVTAKSVSCTYYLLGVYVWLFLFGCHRSCLRILPALLIVGGSFASIAFFAYGKSVEAAMSMANRFGAIFLAAAIGMSVEYAAMTRALSQVHVPRSVTLGMLIATSFVPVLRAEIRRVREAMRTRGAGSAWNPGIFYRAFLVPLVMRLVGISDTLALSVETRAFALGKVKYTVYKKETVALSDVIFLLGLMAGSVCVVLL